MAGKKSGLYYGWVIVMAGLLVTAAGVGIAGNCFSLFIRPVSEELSFSRQAMSANQTLMAMISMVVVLFTGAIYSRFRLMRLMKLGVVLLACSYFCFSFARHIAAFYLLSIAVSIGQSLTTWIPLSIIIGNWFRKRRGLAIGLAFMGSGIGGMLFNILAGQWIGLFGWRPTFRILAVIIALILVPCVFFVLRAHPYDKGLEPYGEEDGEGVAESAAYGPALHEIIRTPRFIVLCSALALLGLPLNAGPATLVPHLTDTGYGAAAAANTLACLMGILAVSKALLGFVFDKLGIRLGTLLSFVAIFIGLIGLAFAGMPSMIALIVFGIGFGCSFGSVALPLIAHSAYGSRSYGAINGIFSAVCSFGNALAPFICGRVYDLTGSYRPAYIAFCTVVLVFAVVLIAALPKSNTLNAKERMNTHAEYRKAGCPSSSPVRKKGIAGRFSLRDGPGRRRV